MSQQNLFKGRDKRNKGWFWLDNDYLNGYAKLFGAVGTAIYVSLCRHADNETQKCFPAMELMATELGVSRNTISKYLKLFERHHLVAVEKERDPRTKKWLNNVYTLLDKEEWDSHTKIKEYLKPCSNSVHGENKPSHAQPLSDPCTTDSESHAQQLCNKEDSYKETHTRKTHIAEASSARAFSLKEEIQKLEESNRRDMNILGFFFSERKTEIRNKEQLQKAIRQHIRAAGKLVPFEDDQLVKGFKKAKEITSEWVLETVVKVLTK